MKIRHGLYLLVAIAVLYIAGCEGDKLSSQGLYLPKGNAERGRLAFIELQCYQCHTVTGVSLPSMQDHTPMITFNLAGLGSRVRTYSELVTAIINPDHITSPQYAESLGTLADAGPTGSPMPALNDRMTVTQLIDLVMFLNARYEDLFLGYIGHSYVSVSE